MPAQRRSSLLGAVLVTWVLAAGCGGTKPTPVVAVDTPAPADLCATLPPATRVGLISTSSLDDTGASTAACSLRSSDGSGTDTRAIVTLVQGSDEIDAGQILTSQCRAIDHTQFREQVAFKAAGADQACAGSGTIEGADSATLAAVTGMEVVTVRVSFKPATRTAALARGQQMLEGVLKALRL